MDAHQRRVIGRLIDEVDAYLEGQTGRARVVENLRGLVNAAGLDEAADAAFYEVWSPLDAELELLTEPWAPAGSGSETRFVASLNSIRAWAELMLGTDAPAAHRT